MSRSLASTGALILLLGLTGASLLLSRHEGSAWIVAGIAVVKAGIIGAVFLELDRSWPGWALAGLLLVLSIAFGASALLS